MKVRRPSATPPPSRSPAVPRRPPQPPPSAQQPAIASTSATATAPAHPSPASTPKAPLAASNLAALSLAASFIQASQPFATSMESPVSHTSDQVRPHFRSRRLRLTHAVGLLKENENPLDLRVERDGRSDEERFAEMHGSLQALTDHLLACRGPDFDSKLRQLRIILRSWDLHKA